MMTHEKQILRKDAAVKVEGGVELDDLENYRGNRERVQGGADDELAFIQLQEPGRAARTGCP